MNNQLKRRLTEGILEEYEPYVVSLSEPYQHEHTLEGIKCKKPAGGLTAGLDPVMRATGGTWIAMGTGDADWEKTEEKSCVEVPPENPRYTLRRVRLSKSEMQNFYYGFNHETFWPLLHQVFHRPDFTSDFWEGYKKGNLTFAKDIFDEIGGDEKSLIWFHDFQLTLAPRFVRNRLDEDADVKMMQFIHTPWPPYRRLSRCPWYEEILDGLLANDMVGFHLPRYSMNFLESVSKIPGADVDYGNSYADYEGRRVQVYASPISVDFTEIDESAREEEVEEEVEDLGNYPYLSDKIIGLGIDRLDYAKGIPERVKAIDRFLEKYPEYKGEFVFVQAGAPLLSRVAGYRKLSQKVEELTDEINMKYEIEGWKPIWFIEEKIKTKVLRAFQRLADIYIVSSLHDGMNLVAKENVATDIDKSGVLLLSRFTGAHEELEKAISINPFDLEGFSDSIKEAVELSDSEKEKRMKSMRETVKNHDIYDWLADSLNKAEEHLVL